MSLSIVSLFDWTQSKSAYYHVCGPHKWLKVDLQLYVSFKNRSKHMVVQCFWDICLFKLISYAGISWRDSCQGKVQRYITWRWTGATKNQQRESNIKYTM